MPMNEVPNVIWNQIAYEQDLETEWAKEMFNQEDEEALEEAVERQRIQLRRSGLSGREAMAFRYLMPSVAEPQAIANFLCEHEDLWWIYRGAIPDIADVDEALYIASREWWLGKEEQYVLGEAMRMTLEGRLKEMSDPNYWRDKLQP